jgi:hypothetical protein
MWKPGSNNICKARAAKSFPFKRVYTWTVGMRMDYKELLEKYNALLEHVNLLTEENIHLRTQLELPESELVPKIASAKSTETDTLHKESTRGSSYPAVDCTSDSLSKIRLFMSLFKGRKDVYAKRWENKNKGTSGYAPVCLNQWQRGICGKPKIHCSSSLLSKNGFLKSKAISY